MEEKKCSICYENLILENSLITPCKHFFCSQCFFRWIRTKNTCPMCRKDLINQERIYIPSYSTQLIELIAKGEEISIANMGIINENMELNRELKLIKNEINENKETERKLLFILSKGNDEVKKQREKLKNIRTKIRIEKIKQINLKKQKLRKYGKIYL